MRTDFLVFHNEHVVIKGKEFVVDGHVEELVEMGVVHARYFVTELEWGIVDITGKDIGNFIVICEMFNHCS